MAAEGFIDEAIKVALGAEFKTSGVRDGVFVKVAGVRSGMETARNEYELALRLWKTDPVHFVRPLAWSDEGGRRTIRMEAVDGRPLEPSDLNAKVIAQLLRIVDELAMARVVHRDFHFGNLLLDRDGIVKLVDFQFAVEVERYREWPFYLRHPFRLRALGCPFAVADSYSWDDMRSLRGMLATASEGCDVAEAVGYVSARIGRNRIRFPRLWLWRYRLLETAISLLPIRSWRHHFRNRLRGSLEV